MTESYHFESVPKFRIGGVYRQKNLTVVRLVPMSERRHVDLWAERLPGRLLAETQDVEDGHAKGYIRLDDGVYVGAKESNHPQDLIPGEMIECDGQWVPIDPIVVYKPAQYIQRSEPESVPMVAHTSADICGRHPLPESDAWRYTGKQRDDFTDFAVTREQVIDFILPVSRPAAKGSTLHAHPGKGSALLRG